MQEEAIHPFLIQHFQSNGASRPVVMTETPLGSLWTWSYGSATVTALDQASLQQVVVQGRLAKVDQWPPQERHAKLLALAKALLPHHPVVPTIESDELRIILPIRYKDFSSDLFLTTLETMQALSDEWDDQFRTGVSNASAEVTTPMPIPTAGVASTKAPVVPLLDWSDPLLRGTGVIQSWAEALSEADASSQLGMAAQSKALPDCLVEVGRAAVIETNHVMAAASAARAMAELVKLPFVALKAEALLESLLSLQQLGKPMVVFLPGDTMWQSKELDGSDDPAWVQSTLSPERLGKTALAPRDQARLIRGLLLFGGLHGQILITHCNSLDNFSELLSMPGLFDRKFRIPHLTKQVLGMQVLNELGLALCSKSLQLQAAKVHVLFDNFSLQKRHWTIHQLRRLQRSLSRPLEFSDLIDGNYRQFVEMDSPAGEPESMAQQVHAQRLVAYHEAGHAVLDMVSSNGQRIPEHATILSQGSTGGFVMHAFDLSDHQRIPTYHDFVSRIRCALAGRAAEELEFGIENVTIGAASDIHTATHEATIYFARLGFSPQMELDGRAGSNLCTWDLGSPDMRMQVQEMVRELLDREYEKTKEILIGHRELLDSVASALLADPVQDQSELKRLWEERHPKCQVL